VTQGPGTARLITCPTDVHGRGRDGIELEMRVFQLWRVRDGKVVVMQAFLTEHEALAATPARAGLSRRRPPRAWSGCV